MLTAGVSNLGLDASFEYPKSDGDLLAFRVSESLQGDVDLNGDGDANDFVMHLYNAATGTTVNLGIDADQLYELNGNLLAFEVNEARQGDTDLNGDGDTLDRVAYLYDASSGTLTNLGVDVERFQLDGNLLAMLVREGGQGSTDLNGDGDASDSVLHVYNAAAATMTNLGFTTTLHNTVGGDPFRLNGNLLAFGVNEFSQGDTDLNGDGDDNDFVVHVYDASSNTTTNLGLYGGGFEVGGGRVVWAVSESHQGFTDLNGDGDVVDSVLHIYDAASHTTTNLGIAAYDIQMDGDLLAIRVAETSGPRGSVDLNGDGDTSDVVMQLYNIASGTTTNLGLDAQVYQLKGNLLALEVSEFRQGHADLNGDGDASDLVMHVYDIAAGTTTNLGLAAGGFLLGENLLAFAVSESSQGNTDLNGDGDTIDSAVVHVYDIAAGTTTNLGVSAGYYFSIRGQVKGNFLVFNVGEASQGSTDLNGDGDESDEVVHVYDAGSGNTTNLKLASGSSFGGQPLFLDGNRITFKVNESYQGDTDLNGDGDSSDQVLHVVDLSIALLDPVVLIDQLLADVDALDLLTGAETSLTAKLEAVVQQLGVDVPESGGLDALMDAFVIGVDHWFELGQISDDVRDGLIADSEFIESLLLG